MASPSRKNQSPAAKAKAARNKAIYNAKPEQIKSRTAQNLARKNAVDAGRARKGDGQHVNHKTLMANGGDPKGATEVVSAKKNQGWRKGNPEAYGKTRKA